jgi:hypothetical protein
MLRVAQPNLHPAYLTYRTSLFLQLVAAYIILSICTCGVFPPLNFHVSVLIHPKSALGSPRGSILESIWHKSSQMPELPGDLEFDIGRRNEGTAFAADQSPACGIHNPRINDILRAHSRANYSNPKQKQRTVYNARHDSRLRRYAANMRHGRTRQQAVFKFRPRDKSCCPRCKQAFTVFNIEL